ncbi:MULTISPECIES: hypothetical protein [unclassified Pseudomonas]|uniref:hypothetical protein n=1 Tax=unclassified Pseudomonas TaxID=196821 RepID=UPI00068EA6A3|nr:MULTISPECIES: hypothetical protein [unclassified Pseudomonas]
MSIYTLERVLWDMHTSSSVTQKFHADVDGLLAVYPLSNEEKVMIKSLDVRSMADMGVSQMLLFCSWQAIHGGGASISEYMRRMNTPSG